MNIPINLSPQKRAFLVGTILLTGTGFFCRVLGFFYRIFLSRTIGAEGLGLFNMLHPIYGICFALCAGSMQTALSQYIASHLSKGRIIFRTGLCISMALSFILAYLICRYADTLAVHVLMEPRCSQYLPIMGLSIPFAAFNACINGYYYGSQNARIPAYSQVVEQIIRMILVFLIAQYWIENGIAITVHLAILGHLFGEMASAVFTFLCLNLCPPQPRRQLPDHSARATLYNQIHTTAVPLVMLALPLMGNRLVINILASAESIWIPSRLQMSGLTNSEALASYGVLTGMALPFILFPSAITNSMAVLLLPSVAQAQAEGKKSSIAASISVSLRYSLYMGILCIGIFTLFGDALGSSVFHDLTAGYFIQVLAWLCPFLYLATTMGSILNGLGKTKTTFIHNVSALLLRIAFVLFIIPHYGILAYLWGMLASETVLALMHLWSLKKMMPIPWNAGEMIVKPALLLIISIGVYYFLRGFIQLSAWLPLFFETAVWIFVISFIYCGLLLVFHFGKKTF